MADGRVKVTQALAALETWIEKEQFRGWGVYDALNSPLLKRLTFGNRLLGVVWVQLFKRSPINFRPLAGVHKGYNPKGMGLFLASYLRKYWMNGEEKSLEKVHFFSQWLQENVSPGYSGVSWGYNFDWPNRGFFSPAGTPTIVNTAFNGFSFLDFGQTPAMQTQARNALESFTPNWLDVARSACEFILRDLNRHTPEPGHLCFSYTPYDQRYIHNANILGAQLLGLVYSHTQEAELAETALAAARYTIRHQRNDGSWAYGEGNVDGWVDNFHTGYVLNGLLSLRNSLGLDEFDDAIECGYDFWKTNLFLSDGTPKYYPHDIYPIDIHSVAQAILTFLAFSEQDADAQYLAWRSAEWGINHMQDAQGYFHFQLNRYYRIRIPYMRWSQAWMQRALNELLWQTDQYENSKYRWGSP